jgi:methyl-accepting chemotaxis protein
MSPEQSTAARLPPVVSEDVAKATPTPSHPNRRRSDPMMSDLARRAGELGHDIVEVSGFVEDLDLRSQAQISALKRARQNTDDVIETNRTISDSLGQMRDSASAVEKLVDGSVQRVQEAGDHSNEIVEHVVEITENMEEVLTALKQVTNGNQSINEIATTVHLLAINARIEAARAGEAGAGFATIASAINELANNTAKTVDTVQGSLEELNQTIRRLSEGSQAARTKTDKVIAGNHETNAALGKMAEAMHALSDQTASALDQAGRVHQATGAFDQAFHDIEASILDTSNRVSTVRKRTTSLDDRTEEMVQDTVSIGAKTEDTPFIERVKQDAARISALFENAIQDGQISHADLFSRNYTPIQGTNPEQVMARFTHLTDQLLPTIQEAALSLSPQVVFCAAVNLDGYLPTHNIKFSKPQGSDVAWNTGNCRNRRIFDDRVGLKAGQNTREFLLQVYRRDMGGGVFKIMKDVSAPIKVQGQHWGGLRLAYTV